MGWHERVTTGHCFCRTRTEAFKNSSWVDSMVKCLQCAYPNMRLPSPYLNETSEPQKLKDLQAFEQKEESLQIWYKYILPRIGLCGQWEQLFNWFILGHESTLRRKILTHYILGFWVMHLELVWSNYISGNMLTNNHIFKKWRFLFKMMTWRSHLLNPPPEIKSI